MAIIRASQSITFTDLYDASGFEYIYTKTISSIDDAGDFLSSQLPSDSWTYGLPSPDGGTDGISWSTYQGDLSNSFPVLWQCRRFVNGNPATGDSVPAQWETPTRIAMMGGQGPAGEQGPAGAPGADALGAARSWNFSMPTEPGDVADLQVLTSSSPDA